MPSRWVNRTYTYSEPVDEPEPRAHGITGPDTYGDTVAIRAGYIPDFDAGFDAGFRAGYAKGYATAYAKYSDGEVDHKREPYGSLFCYNTPMDDNHDCGSLEECWMWWVGTWRAQGITDYGTYNKTVAAELFDFHALCKGLPVLYDSITGGRISKPTTFVKYVIDAVEHRLSDEYDEGYRQGSIDARYGDGID